MTVSYVKVVVEGEIACYINTDHFVTFFEEYVKYPSRIKMVQFADCAINLKTNELIKCRRTLESIFDNGFPRPIVIMHFEDVK